MRDRPEKHAMIAGTRRVGAVRRAFSIIDLLVSISVVLVLMGLLIPSLAAVRETARRVVCSSNIRQMGFGLVLYADANKDKLAPTAFLEIDQGPLRPGELIRLRVESEPDQVRRSDWDGLGHLYGQDILAVPMLFYCPSHKGDHPFQRYSDRWLSQSGQIVGNYQYRGKGPNGSSLLSRIEPSRAALVADGMRTQADYSHATGANVLRADMSVAWFSDPNGTFAEGLPEAAGTGSSQIINNAWGLLDAKVSE
jgi:hypothetical protein